jgi:hypothetical protein
VKKKPVKKTAAKKPTKKSSTKKPAKKTSGRLTVAQELTKAKETIRSLRDGLTRVSEIALNGADVMAEERISEPEEDFFLRENIEEIRATAGITLRERRSYSKLGPDGDDYVWIADEPEATSEVPDEEQPNNVVPLHVDTEEAPSDPQPVILADGTVFDPSKNEDPGFGQSGYEDEPQDVA